MGEQQHGQDVAGRGAHAGDHAVDHAAAVLPVRPRDHAPRGDHAVGRLRKIRLDREEGARTGDLVRQQRLLVGFGQVVVVFGLPVEAQQFGDGRAMQARVLADVERDEVQPEQADFFHQAAQRAIGDELALIRLEAVADDAQIASRSSLVR